MPTEVLYGIISFLGLAVLTQGGLWVRAQDNHRDWAVDKITQHEKDVAVLRKGYEEIHEDIKEIKHTLTAHMEREEKFQIALAAKFDLKIG